MKTTLILLLLLAAPAQSADYTDSRMGGLSEIKKDSDGNIIRSMAALESFRALYPCPVNNKKTGECPGWALNNVIPLEVGGKDVLENIQWLPTTGTCHKDEWARLVYNGEVVDKYVFPSCYE